MSSLDVGGFDEIERELRAARPGAPPSLREQVLALGEPAPRPVPRPRWSRRAVLVLASAAAVTAAAASVVIGLVQSGSDRPVAVQPQSRGQDHGALGAPIKPTTLGAERALKRNAQPATTDAGLPVTSSRVQRYEADLTLRVGDLSATTKRALRLTHRFGGYVRSVDYGSGEQAGHADLVVRIPLRRVQEAILRFSSLGTILDQHVRVQDLQPSIDRRFRRMQAIRRQITALAGDTSPEAQAKVARLRRALVALQREQSQAVKRAEFATIALALRTKEAEVVPARRPGRIERALDHAGTILIKELAVLVYGLVVAVPLALVAAAAFIGARALRRRSLDRLLEQN
jgi:hypothetical protein